MGVPSVFHTAPPQPASNARCTWPPEFAGGADASQKRLSERMPAQFGEIATTDVCLQRTIDCARGTLAFGQGIHHVFSAVRTVATLPDLRSAREGVGADDDAALLELVAGQKSDGFVEVPFSDREQH